jgi:hypothetical protein
MEEKLTTKISLDISLGHLLLIWETLANKVSCSPINEQLSDVEKRAIWALEDICEQKLVENDCGSRPEQDWHDLIKKAGEHVKTLPVEFLE